MVLAIDKNHIHTYTRIFARSCLPKKMYGKISKWNMIKVKLAAHSPLSHSDLPIEYPHMITILLLFFYWKSMPMVLCPWSRALSFAVHTDLSNKLKFHQFQRKRSIYPTTSGNNKLPKRAREKSQREWEAGIESLKELLVSASPTSSYRFIFCTRHTQRNTPISSNRTRTKSDSDENNRYENCAYSNLRICGTYTFHNYFYFCWKQLFWFSFADISEIWWWLLLREYILYVHVMVTETVY